MDVIIIPAYQPDVNLIFLVNKLQFFNSGTVIVVDDGSPPSFQDIFNKIERPAVVLKHIKNMGKGEAIKTALKYIQSSIPGAGSIVTLDADGQHNLEDAQKLLCASRQNRGSLILGARDFTGDIPKRSKIGNKITRSVFYLLSHKHVSDTQTGLRAFSSDLIPFMLSIDGSRYEYEVNVLMSCAKKDVAILEVPIKTIYHDIKNSCSHFRSIRDSFRIYINLLAFAGSSFLSFIVDYILFFPFMWLSGLFLPSAASLAVGNVSARIVSASLNYYLNSTYIFKQRNNRFKTARLYAILACIILMANTAILYLLCYTLPIPAALAKCFTEVLMFSASYIVQKTVIFSKHVKCNQ